MLLIENGLLFDIDFVRWLILFDSQYVVSDFPLYADVSDKTVSCLGIDSWKIACIWISIWISILYIEKRTKSYLLLIAVIFFVDLLVLTI